MDEDCVLAISGTPGVGKSSLCAVLEARGWNVLSLATLADEHGCLDDIDTEDGAAPIDVHRLAETWERPTDGRWLVDGHLAHLLEVDGIVLLRCQPERLRERLTARGYTDRKVQANVEWEMTAGHWAELVEFEVDLPLLELDATTDDEQALSGRVNAWVEGGMEGAPLMAQVPDSIDWLGE